MIEVFATNIRNNSDARVIKGLLSIQFPKFHINFDLSDIDNILRIESSTYQVESKAIVNYVRDLGFKIKVLE